MRQALTYLPIVVLTTALHSALAEDFSQETTIDRSLEAVELVLEHHLKPPTRQEMVLAIARSIYGPDAPRDLSRQVSDAADQGALREILSAACSGRKVSLEQVDQALDAVVPGGVAILPAEEQRVQSQFDSNRYVGTGIALSMNDETPVMQKVFPGGPAANVGARDGDQILEIDGTDTAGLQIQEIVKLLRGPEGDPVTVMLQQPGENEQRLLTIVRGVVPFQHVHYEVVGAGDQPRIAHVKIDRISASTVHELEQFGKRFADDGVAGILLDLTTVAQETGTVHHAVLLADALLDDKPIGVVRTSSGDELRRSAPGELFPGLPLCVLVNAQTSGTAEWLAAAIESAGRGEVYGGATAGDVMMQDPLPLGDGSVVLRMDTAELRHADGSAFAKQSAHARNVGQTSQLFRIVRPGSPPNDAPAVKVPVSPPVSPQQLGLEGALEGFRRTLRSQP